MAEANWHTYQVLTKRYGLPRVQHLRATSAATRFLSIEPLLEDLGDARGTSQAGEGRRIRPNRVQAGPAARERGVEAKLQGKAQIKKVAQE